MKRSKLKIKPKFSKSSDWEIVEDIPMAQDGGYQWSTQKQEPVKLAIPKDVNVSKTESNRKLTPKELEELRKYTEEQNQLRKEEEYNKRLQAIQQANQAKNQPLTIDNLRTQTQATGDKMSFAMNTRFGNPKEYPTLSGYMDALDFINPGKFIGDMATGLGALPHNIREGNYGQAALAVGLPLATGAIGSFGQKPAGSLFREQVYKGIDPVAYGMKEKLKSAPKTWLKNTLAKDEQQRALEIGKQLSNLNPEYFANDITRIGQNRLDAFRVGLKLPQRYDTFEKIGENTYRIKNMNPQVGEFSSVYNDLVANDYLKNATGVYHGENPLVTIAKKHDKLTSPTIKTEFGDYSVNDLRRYLMKEKDELPAWEQHRIVEKAKNPEFTHSVYDADRQGIMGSFRWDIKKPSFENDYKLHFQSNDLWNLNPFEKRGQISVKGNEKLLENWYKPLENFEALSFVGGKPFNIQNNFVVDPKTYQILQKYKQGGKIKTDPQGYWNPENINEPMLNIPSNYISMENIPFPILGISDTGDTKIMQPNQKYKFKGKNVKDIPMAQDGKLIKNPTQENSYYTPSSKFGNGGDTDVKQDPEKEWLKNWINHPEYRKRLLNSENKNIKFEKNKEVLKPQFEAYNNTIINRANEAIDSTKIFNDPNNNNKAINDYLVAENTKDKDFKKRYNEVYNNTYGESNTNSLNTIINNRPDLYIPWNNPTTPQETKIHELVHQTRLDTEFLPYGFQKGTIPKAVQTEKWSNRTPDYNYYHKLMSGTSEVYPEIMSLRYKENIQPGEIITPEKWQKIKERNPDNHFIKGYQDDKQAIEILNTVASNNSKNELDMAKNGKKIKTDPKGYWNKDNHGKPVRIPSNRITMKGVNQPLLGISDTGDIQMMSPGMEYSFDGNSVTEFPVTMQQGGNVRQPIKNKKVKNSDWEIIQD